MKITFADKNGDDFARVIGTGLLNAEVHITASEWEDPNKDLPTEYHDSNVEIWDGFGDIVDIGEEGLSLKFDDGSSEVYVPYWAIEEVKYL